MAEGDREHEVDSGKGSPESAWTALLRTLGTKALTALLTVGGLATFAAFAGSVVLWTRFDALQLPPDQIVDVAPRGELVAVGATMLLLFGFCGGVAALAVYLIDRGGRATPGMSQGVVVIVALEAIAAIWLAGGTDILDRVIATEVVVLAFGAILWATFVGGLVDRKEGDIPALYPEEGVQRIEEGPFRDRHNTWKWGRWKAAGALLAGTTFGGIAWVVAWAITDMDDAWGWLCGLIALGMTLLLAVLVQWYVFMRGRADARQTEAEKAEKKRIIALQQYAVEEEERKEVERKAEKAAEAARRAGRIAGVASWLKATWEYGGLTLSFGHPGVDPRPPDEWEPRAPEPAAPLRPLNSELTPHGSMLMVSLAAVATALPALILGELWLAVTMATVVGLGLGLWRVARLSAGRFLWYGLAVLISVPLFGTVALASRNLDDPQVQPMAMIRDGDGPAEALQGLYVTENNDRVYFANVATQGCGKEVVGDSGRLLWVPNDEVVAISIGPLQDVDKAARASLEMAQALTPALEASAAGRVEGEETTGDPVTDEEGEPKNPTERLATAGPAVRLRFGRGLRLQTDEAVPGQRVKLVLSTPEYGGFSDLLDGSSLRLNGLKLPIVAREVADEDDEDVPRQEWLEFTVPPGATSGVVTVECAQLAGLPYLTVPRKPAAQVAVRMKAGSRRVVFDSSGSRDRSDKSENLSRSWTIAGLRKGRAVIVGADLPPRLAPYRVSLVVTDSEGRKDRVDLRLLRLPQSRFPFGADRPADRKSARRVRRALRRLLERDDPPELAAIEIAGHADSVDTDRFNFDLSLDRARWMRRWLFAPRGEGDAPQEGSRTSLGVNGGDRLPLVIRAFGESCPIVRRPGPQELNRRVEVFLLGPGSFVAAPKGCRAGRLRHSSW